MPSTATAKKSTVKVPPPSMKKPKVKADPKTVGPTRLKDLAERTGDLLHVDPFKIVVEQGFNVRTDRPELKQHIQELAASITEQGVLKPLTVRFSADKRMFLVDGHCRLEAVKLAIKKGIAIKTVPAVAEARHTSDRDRILSLVTHNSGLPLSPLEQGAVFLRLKTMGEKPQAIADRLGRSLSHVSNLIGLAESPDDVKALAAGGKMSETTVNNAVRDYKDQAGTVLRTAVRMAETEGRSTVKPKDVKKAAARIQHKAGGTVKLTQEQQTRAVAIFEDILKTETDHTRAKKLTTDFLKDIGLR